MSRGGKIHFVRSTQARPTDVLAVAGKSLWRNCAAAFNRIDVLCGEDASALFAEPNVKEQDGGARLAVAWFGHFDDEPKQLNALDRGMRSKVEADLAARIDALRPALADPEFGETVAAMLNVADEKSVFAVGENAVLTNWGMLPEEARASQSAFARHGDRTIGQYLPAGITPRVPGQPWSLAAGPGAAGLSPRRRANVPAATPPRPAAAVDSPPARRAAWIWPAALLSAVFAGCLAYLVWPGNRIFPEVIAPKQPTPIVDSSEVNRSLEERISKLRNELAKPDACQINASLLGIPADPPASLPSAGGAASADGGPLPSSGASPRGPLAALDSATVLVIAPQGEGSVGTGSGFFVGPRDILTNHHVVKGAGETVFVASKALLRMIPAKVIAKSANDETGEADFALLRVDETVSGVTPLQLSTGIGRLDSVVAGGFPSSVMSMDSAYQAILESGGTAGIDKLEIVVTQGNVMAMPHGGGAKLITHSASISPGNSGGPLADACGRAVGVNTFIVLDGQNVQKLNFSLGAVDAIQFLAANGVSVTPADQPCSPAAANDAAAPPAAEAPPQ